MTCIVGVKHRGGVTMIAALRVAERFTGGVRRPRLVIDVPRGAR